MSDTNTKNKLPTTAEMARVVQQNPGLTTSELAEKLDCSSIGLATKLHAMANVANPSIRRIKREGQYKGYRHYSFDYQFQNNPFNDRVASVVAVAGMPIRVHKVTPEEMAEIERRNNTKGSKYLEVINILESLEVGEGAYIELKDGSVSLHGIRDATSSYFKDGAKKFTVHGAGRTHGLVKRAA